MGQTPKRLRSAPMACGGMVAYVVGKAGTSHYKKHRTRAARGGKARVFLDNNPAQAPVIRANTNARPKKGVQKPQDEGGRPEMATV